MTATGNQILRTFRFVPYRFVTAYLALGWRLDPNEPLDHHHRHCVTLEHCGPGYPIEPERSERLAEQPPFDFEPAREAVGA